MKSDKISYTILIAISICLLFIFFISCKSGIKTGSVIITRIPAKNTHEYNFINGENWRYLFESQIIAINPEKSGKAIKILSKDFYSASCPEISYDACYMLFAAQQKQGDYWQIWEMNLKDLKKRQITYFKDDCVDPVYLPGNCFAFSKKIINDTIGTIHALFTGSLDGSNIKQITFHPHVNFASTVLNDGRLITISRQVYPDIKNSVYMVLRPDGTKADIFYIPADSNVLLNRARDTKEGLIYFIETRKNNRYSSDIVVINQNRPLFTRINLTSSLQGSFSNIFPLQSGKLLVTCRLQSEKQFALHEFNPADKSISPKLYESPGFDIVEAVVVEEHDWPKKLPSELDEEVKTGLFMCQNINYSDSCVEKGLSLKVTSIEVLGIDTTYGIVKVEEDGSFYLKIIANIPFRIQTIDEKGKVINEPYTWLWLRPNERRGWIGFNKDPELTPENLVPMAVKKAPVIIPIHIDEISEKEVSLE